MAGAVYLLIMALDAPIPTTAVGWGSVALAAYCAALVLIASAAAGHKGMGLGSWKIGSWSLGWVAVTFGLATITWTTPQSGDAAEISLSSVLRALWLTAVATTAFTAGYCAGPRRLAEQQTGRLVSWPRRRFGDDIRSSSIPWVLFAVGTVAQAAFTATTGRFGYVGNAASQTTTASGYGQLLATIATCGPLSIAVAAILFYRTRARGARLTVAILFTTEIAIGAAAGGKQSYVVAILAVLIPRAAMRKQLPPGIIVATLLIFLVIIIPFNQAYRSNARGTAPLSAGQAIAAGPVILGQVIAADKSPSVIATSMTYMAQRIREIDSPAIIMQRTPGQIPYDSPVQLVEGPLADLIPRAVWPGKPILASGYKFGQLYFGLPPSVYTSTAITLEGDLYQHGGWAPLVAAMFLLGCFIRVLDDVLDIHTNTHAIILLVMIFPGLIKAEGDWATTLAGLPALFVLWAAVVLFSFVRIPREMPGRPAVAGTNGHRSRR